MDIFSYLSLKEHGCREIENLKKEKPLTTLTELSQFIKDRRLLGKQDTYIRSLRFVKKILPFWCLASDSEKKKALPFLNRLPSTPLLALLLLQYRPIGCNLERLNRQYTDFKNSLTHLRHLCDDAGWYRDSEGVFEMVYCVYKYRLDLMK